MWQKSIFAAANKVLHFNRYKKVQGEALNKVKGKKIDEESVPALVKKIFDFDKFKKQQAEAIVNFNKQLLGDSKTMKYADDLDLDDVRENKNVKIAAKRISNKYRKMRKRHIISKEQPIEEETFENFTNPTKKSKRQIDKATQIAAQKISKK